MARDIKVSTPTKEEIVSYEYYLSGSVRVTIGLGDLDGDGKFIQDQTQGTRLYDLVGDSYNKLMEAKDTKPEGRFRVEDLWDAVDTIESEKVRVKENSLEEVITKNKI